MRTETLTVYDQELLHYLAEEVLMELRFSGFLYDEEGNRRILRKEDAEEDAWFHEALERFYEESPRNNFDFLQNPELRKLRFRDALEMPFSVIKETYLRADLAKARGMMRKGGIEGLTVSEEVPDSYLDDLIALRWRENLKLWTMQWEKEKEKEKKKETDPEDKG